MSGTNIYRKPALKPHVGQLRTRTWRTVLPPGASDTNIPEPWPERCKDYWELQERLYGWRFSDFTILLDVEHGFVSTYAVITEILPGERTPDAARVPATRVQ